MSASSLADINCAIAKTLGVIGEWWSLTILRNIFTGMVAFAELEKHLGLSIGVLSARLKTLTEAKVLTRQRAKDDAQSFEYHLTERGYDLYPILVALTDWGEKWMPNTRGIRVKLVEKRTGEMIQGAVVLSDDGSPLKPWDVDAIAGPGADEKINHLLGKKAERV
jgi:DNA-binding HxlR family transcriptional regulator